MQAIVLVGGEGTRLRPLTYGTPKPMVPIMNVPFLARTLERLYAAEIREVILAAGYMPQAIVDYFGDGTQLGMKVTYAIEETPLGTAGAIKNVEPHIDGPFFVLNGDILTSLDLRAMRAYHESKGGIGTLHLIRVEDPSHFGCVVHDANGRVSAFVEKPPQGEEPTDEINAGTYLLEREILQYIPPGRNVSIERATFPEVIADGKALYAYTTSDYWLDLGRPEQYLAAHRDVLSGAMPLARRTRNQRRRRRGATRPSRRDSAGARRGRRRRRRERKNRTERRARRVVQHRRKCGGARIGALGARQRRRGRGYRRSDPRQRGHHRAEGHVAKGSVIGHDVTIDPGAVLEPGARLGSPAEEAAG